MPAPLPRAPGAAGPSSDQFQMSSAEQRGPLEEVAEGSSVPAASPGPGPGSAPELWHPPGKMISEEQEALLLTGLSE